MDADTPQGAHGNQIRQLSTTTVDHNDLTISVECSDIIKSQYEGFSRELKAVKVKDLKIMRKELDEPLNFFKSIGARIFNVNPQHRFILIQTEEFVASIDFYIDNRVIVRLGDRHFVMDEERSQARRNAELVRLSNGLEWRRIIKQGDEELTFGEIMEHLFTMNIKDFSQISYKGEEFSQDLFIQIRDELIRNI